MTSPMSFTFTDGTFAFWAADRASDSTSVFRSRIVRDPRDRLAEKHLTGQLRSARPLEIALWMDTKDFWPTA